MLENFLNNLLILGILTGLFLIIYCKVKGVTIGEIISDIREGMQGE